MELPPYFYFPWLHCNLLNWSCLPFLFCAIALQSIKLELPPFFYFVLLHCNLLNWSYLPFFYFARLHWNLLNWSYLPFLFCAIAYLKFSKFIKLRSISLVQSSVFSWFRHYGLGPSGYLFLIRHCSFCFWSSKSFDFICTDET